MPKSQMEMDAQMPNLKGKESNEQKFAMISDYLFQLAEHQRYLFSNLDGRNFNRKGLTDIASWIQKPVYAKIADSEGNITEIKATVEGISTKVSNMEGNVSSLTQTANNLSGTVSDIEGNVSSLQLYAQKLETKVSGLEGKFSSISQKVDSIQLSVSNKETSSTIELKAGSTVLSSKEIKMSGLVTFAALSQEGQTTINGSNITTGTLRAEFVKLRGKFEVYSGNTMGGYIGYMSGSTGSELTNGIGVCNIASDCYVIATDAGVAVKAGNNAFHITKTGGAKCNCKMIIDADLVVNGKISSFNNEG